MDPRHLKSLCKKYMVSKGATYPDSHYPQSPRHGFIPAVCAFMLNVKKNLSSLQKIKVSLSSNTKHTCSGQMAVQCRETAYSLGPRVMSGSRQTWQARSFGAKRQQAETPTSPRLLLDGAFPIPPATQISSVAARCAIAIFPRAAARWSAGSVRPAPADRRRSPCGSAAPASAPAPGGTRRRPPFSLP